MGCRYTTRKTEQLLLPLKKPELPRGEYNIYPTGRVPGGRFLIGFKELARAISDEETIIIDGYVGVFFDDFKIKLIAELNAYNKKIVWHDTAKYLKSSSSIDLLISDFTGKDDPLFGTRADLSLSDFFDMNALQSLIPDNDADINIISGIGSALVNWRGMLIYIDLPKNELQYRSRAGSAANLGSDCVFPAREAYKRFYFVDWVVLNKHKSLILPKIDIMIDGQNPDTPVSVSGDQLRAALKTLSTNFFRVRPWFEPGVWGGEWIKKHISGLNTDVPNYAWSFELITPENGLILENNRYLMEVSFDTLMYLEHESVLGDHAHIYGQEFPIRFDFLDTINGDNLSIQCHPGKDYILRHFGETYTQEEAYYILDATESAQCYLGFQEGTDPDALKEELLSSFNKKKLIDITKYVQVHKSRKHDLFLIPPETIHGSGKGNLVLEISTTPYIFTFKLYDWVRRDLNGDLRPLNIERGMDNLRFERAGKYVSDHLISRPVLLVEGSDWKLFRLPTHECHSYTVLRYIFRTEIQINTDNCFHVLSLVEGGSALIMSEKGLTERMNYAETFVVPAAANSYRIINEGKEDAMLVVAYLKRVSNN